MRKKVLLIGGSGLVGQSIVLGHIPAGHSYEKTNLSPFSNPSRQCPAFPSIAVNSNCQSSVHHFCILITSNVNINNLLNNLDLLLRLV